MTKKIGPIEKTLRAAKAWLNSPERLVKDWGNMLEDKNGLPVTRETLPRERICHACLMGAVYAAAPLVDAKIAHEFIYLRRPRTVEHYFLRPRSFRAAHAFYDRAIAAAHKQGI